MSEIHFKELSEI